ncbi:hypothetical protein EI427_04070 [Flammeovirga pectinis]|uniref:DUF4369 domain-containing protein n=1 Tax=Flammeovirga pectinis TaxID=2494373 RepID=A0A3S9NZR4_9BACT|nr:hypothetical protein [Flammeovirga pectinis]AZQ61428.1 hypothetical protein EI427_04070 [Flammeovirga pectinis]
MRKSLVLTIAACLLTTLAIAQDYYVLHLTGDIKETSSQRNLIVGDVISPQTELTFFSANAKALVVSAEKGRMLLDGSKAKDNRRGEFIALLENVIMPVAANKNLSSRRVGVIENKDIEDISEFFGSNMRAVLGDTFTLHLDKEVFKKKGGFSYIYQYSIDGKSKINKVLKVYDGEMMLDKKALYLIEDYKTPESGSEVEFYSTNVISKQSNLLAKVNICYVNDKDLWKEMDTLIKALSISGKDQEIIQVASDYINEQYGEPFPGELENWLIKKGFIPASQELK